MGAQSFSFRALDECSVTAITDFLERRPRKVNLIGTTQRFTKAGSSRAE